MNELRKKTLSRLMERRDKLQAAYDAVIAEPASYGITGSVNATNQRLADLRKEIDECEAVMARILSGSSDPRGITIQLPSYR